MIDYFESVTEGIPCDKSPGTRPASQQRPAGSKSRHGPYHAEPIDGMPGSEARIELYAQRHAAGQDLWSGEDLPEAVLREMGRRDLLRVLIQQKRRHGGAA